MVDVLPPTVLGIELNPKLIGALFTDHAEEKTRLFCYYTNGEVSQFSIPAVENRDNLLGFYGALKIDETCTCLIMPEVVMGRLYARHNGSHYLYTILKTTGNTLCALDANIISVRWSVIWHMPGIEILRARLPGQLHDSIAIRTQVGESDAARMMQESKVFTQPVSPVNVAPRNWFYFNISLALLAVAVLVGGAIYYNFSKSAVPAAPAAAVVAGSPASGEPRADVYLLFNHQISGPFPGLTVQRMAAAGVLPPETLWRRDGSSEWSRLADLQTANSTPNSTP